MARALVVRSRPFSSFFNVVCKPAGPNHHVSDVSRAHPVPSIGILLPIDTDRISETGDAVATETLIEFV